MMRAEDVGLTVIYAVLFWHLSCTITLIPFHLPPYFTMSYPTFFAFYINEVITNPRGPNLGARVAAGPGSPPNTLMLTDINFYLTESNFVRIDFWWHLCGINKYSIFISHIMKSFMIHFSKK